ncbi:MAG TPA: chorismate mutase [Candidatus Limnocylindrales bacterium]|nr:chorismate mutase [Candidatus Limnocylindrales bacterium]
MGRSIEEIRKEIDRIDDRLIELLSQRAKLVLEIGDLKKAQGLPVYVPDREQEIHQRVQAQNKGPLSNEAIVRLFKEIIQESRNLEQEILSNPQRDPLTKY